jgi:hypothetical protein
MPFMPIIRMPEIEFAIVNRPKITSKPIITTTEPLTVFITNKINKMNFFTTPVFNSILFSFIGFFILLIAYFIIEKLTPENTWREIVQKNNIAVAIVFAAFIIGISMIISAAIHG